MKQTLSLCMIVKNEEKYLHGCLESVKEVVNQIVIVDTGSTDKTIAIAEKFDAEIFHFKWIDDFAAARNESIKYAKGDWILWMDADERVIPQSKKEIENLLVPEKNPVAYRVQINSIVNNGESTRLSSAHRIFTNLFGLYFTGKIHEQITESAAKLGAEERQSNIILEHLGYNLNESEQSKKDNRNLKMLQKMVQSNPHNGYAHFTLAQQYGMMKDWQKALNHYDKAEKLNQFDKAMKCSLLNTKAETLFYMQRYNQAKNSCEQSIQIEPLQVGAFYMRYRIADAQNDTEACIYNLKIIKENSGKLKSQTKTISTDVIISDERILYTLAMQYLKINRVKDVVINLSEALRVNPDLHQIREKLVDLLLQSGKYEESKTHLNYLIKRFPKEEKYQEMLGIIFIKEQLYSKAIEIFEHLLSKNPTNTNSIKKLVGLYGKTGEVAKANQLLQTIS